MTGTQSAGRFIRSEADAIGRGWKVWLRAALGIILFPPAGLTALQSLFAARALRNTDPRAARARMDQFSDRFRWAVGLAFGVFLAALIAAIICWNDFAVAQGFLNPSKLWASMPRILKGFWFTIKLFVVTEIVVLAWSLVVAILRRLPGPANAPARFFATGYTDLFRGIPALLVIYIVYFGLKRTGLPVLSTMGDFWAGVVALTLTYGAYVGEVIKGGFDSIHWSQAAAAQALGLSYMQTLRLVILPQALRNMMAPLLNAFISLQKDTSLVSVVGMLDAVNWARISSMDLASLTPFTGVALGYLVMTLPATRFTDWWMRKEQAKKMAQ